MAVQTAGWVYPGRRQSVRYPPRLGHALYRTLHRGFMKRLRVGIIDIVSRGPTRALYARVMNANLASIMPQAVGVWCQEEGHDVAFVCYTGFEDLLEELPENVDVVFIG